MKEIFQCQGGESGGTSWTRRFIAADTAEKLKRKLVEFDTSGEGDNEEEDIEARDVILGGQGAFSPDFLKKISLINKFVRNRKTVKLLFCHVLCGCKSCLKYALR